MPAGSAVEPLTAILLPPGIDPGGGWTHSEHDESARQRLSGLHRTCQRFTLFCGNKAGKGGDRGGMFHFWVRITANYSELVRIGAMRADEMDLRDENDERGHEISNLRFQISEKGLAG